MTRFDSIDNPRLIANGLQHLVYERTLAKPSYFRVAREAHLVLCRSMVEAIKGTANLAVTGGSPKKRPIQYRPGNGPWLQIHSVKVTGCQKAWRFSPPSTIPTPNLNLVRSDESGTHLVGFYDLLAMTQSECFMHQFVDSKVVLVTDNEMATLEWLHEHIRNEYEHFVPKWYGAPVKDLRVAADVCLRLAHDLLFSSWNTMLDPQTKHQLTDLFERATQGAPGTEVM